MLWDGLMAQKSSSSPFTPLLLVSAAQSQTSVARLDAEVDTVRRGLVFSEKAICASPLVPWWMFLILFKLAVFPPMKACYDTHGVL